jgi:hypothetical protein
LIPKTGDRSKLRNWRPIILLGSVYKILAKTLAGRLQSFLSGVIRPNQTGFVEGRSILDNVFIAQGLPRLGLGERPGVGPPPIGF